MEAMEGNHVVIYILLKREQILMELFFETELMELWFDQHGGYAWRFLLFVWVVGGGLRVVVCVSWVLG